MSKKQILNRLDELKQLIQKYNAAVSAVQKQLKKPSDTDAPPHLILDCKPLPETPADIEAKIAKKDEQKEIQNQKQNTATHKKEDYQHIIQLMHNLRAELMHMEALLNEDDISVADKAHCFFKRQFEAIYRTHTHWYQLQHYLALTYDDSIEEELHELLELQNRLKHLVEHMERKTNALAENQKYEPLKPELKPTDNHQKDEDKG